MNQERSAERMAAALEPAQANSDGKQERLGIREAIDAILRPSSPTGERRLEADALR